MNIEHLKEYTGEKTQGDQELYGAFIPDGSEIVIKSVASFEGYECRIWAPEFHSLLLDTAIRNAKEAEVYRKKLTFEKGTIDAKNELVETEENIERSFRVMQLSISSLIFSVICVESWANKIIQSEIKETLTFTRYTTETVSWTANNIEKTCHIGEKVFHVIPTLFGIKPVKESITCRKRFKEIIDERNSIIHIKNNPKEKEKILRRKDLALKFLRRNAIYFPKNTITYLEYLHKHGNRKTPEWLLGNIRELIAAEKSIKV